MFFCLKDLYLLFTPCSLAIVDLLNTKEMKRNFISLKLLKYDPDE